MAKRPLYKNISDLRVLRLRDGDVLIVKDSAIPPEERRHFMDHLANTVNKHVVVLFVDSLSDIKRLDSEQLKHVGLEKINNEDD